MIVPDRDYQAPAVEMPKEVGGQHRQHTYCTDPSRASLRDKAPGLQLWVLEAVKGPTTL